MYRTSARKAVLPDLRVCLSAEAAFTPALERYGIKQENLRSEFAKELMLEPYTVL